MFKFFRIVKKIKELKRIEPDAGWLKKERARFAVLSRNEKPAVTLKGIAGIFTLRAAPLLAFFTALALIAGVVGSAQAALPDDILFPIKLFTEKFQSFVIVGDANRVDFALKIAENRLDEADKIEGESAVLGSVKRAGDKIEEATALLEEIALNNQGNSGKGNSKKIEQALKRLEKLEEKKKHLAEKFEKKLPQAVKALEKLGAVSVNINDEENKITVIFDFSNATTSATSTRKDNGGKSNKGKGSGNSGRGSSDNHGAEKIIELLLDGAGKSGKTPPGLLQAPGIKKKLADFFDFDNDENENEGDEDEDDEDDNNGGNDTDTTAPSVSSISATNIASTSALISWVTGEPATSKIYYSSTTPFNFSTALTVSTTTLSANHSLELAPLTASTTYHFAVESADATGNTATSSENSFTTPE